MQDGRHERLPRAALAQFRQDLEDEARLRNLAITITVTPPDGDPVDVEWRVRPKSPAVPPAASAAAAPPAAPPAAPAAAPPGGGGGDLATEIRESAAAVGVDAKALAAIAWVESSFRLDAKNPHSSAFGLFQFLDGTWKDVVQRRGAAHGVTLGQRAELRAQCRMGAAFLADNAALLRNRLGREPTAAECYAAHFFGAGTAARLLAGGPDIQADVALGANADAVIGANQSIFKTGGRIRTVGEVMALFEQKIGRGLQKAGELLG